VEADRGHPVTRPSVPTELSAAHEAPGTPASTPEPAAFTASANVVADAATRPPRDDEAVAHDRPPPMPSYGATGPGAEAAASSPAAGGRASAAPAAWLERARAWLTGGNLLTRMGIVILFFGVAFLLVYFAEASQVPVRVKLAASFVAGLVLAGIGLALGARRPAYGLSLQGAGMGVAYLTTFAAFRLYDALPPLLAIGVLVALAAVTIALALRGDSQALALVAIGGAFLAPFLIRVESPDPLRLFAYLAVVNAAVFALAWRRVWRLLDVVGFLVTFLLAGAWGYREYAPAQYAVAQPFLVLFFAFYVAIVLLNARRGSSAGAKLDGILVFGVPAAAWVLQIALVRDHRYGAAFSALGLAAFYGLLWLVLRGSANDLLARFARASAAIAVAFATLAVPFAFDSRVTSAIWAVEGAAVFALGVVQRQPLARLFALALQLAAALAFAWDTPRAGGQAFLNAAFLGAALIGLAALVSVRFADRAPEALGRRERTLLPWLFAWGVAWWTLAGLSEADVQFRGAARVAVALAWVAGSGAAAIAAGRALGWPRVGWLAALVLPGIVAALAISVREGRATLEGVGWLAWPLAFLVHVLALRAGEVLYRPTPGGRGERVRNDFVAFAHAAGAVAAVAWLSWEASEWAGRFTPRATAWLACAAAWPAIGSLSGLVSTRASTRWPLAPHGDAYRVKAGGVIAAGLGLWVVVAGAISTGNAAPLPYVPLANPLDVTLVAALAALAAWGRAFSRIPAGVAAAWLGAGALLALSGSVARTVHHWAGVRWTLQALADSALLQTALTLTWTATAFALMLWSARKAARAPWVLGAALFAAVIVKLFVVDLAALSGGWRVAAFLGAGVVLIVIGYVAPLPPARAPEAATASPRGGSPG
jgi:uncharacterized membrane protein